ncbi:MAG: hypothetical protein JSW12_18935 [Deltaproteobacteria bacterium]|nr:MAG: hypothetical protein JSW12_18935 [Deltaproteobacteria bacterium]
MARDLPEGAREPEEALDAVVAVDSEQGENALAQIVVSRLPISRALRVMRFSAPNVGHQ